MRLIPPRNASRSTSQIPERVTSGSCSPRLPPARPIRRRRDDQLYHCGGGVDSFAIDPYGEMSICVLSQQDKYALRTGTVQQGWEEFLRRVRGKKKITRLTKCMSCELKAMCGMCPANGELENGDPEAPVDFLCRVAHLRAYAFDLPVPPHGDCEYCAGGSRRQWVDHTADDVRTRAPHNSRRSTPGRSRNPVDRARAVDAADVR